MIDAFGAGRQAARRERASSSSAPPQAAAGASPARRASNSGVRVQRRFARSSSAMSGRLHTSTKRLLGLLRHAAARGALHAEVVREDEAAKAQPFSKLVLQEAPREGGDLPLKGMISHMGRHDGCKFRQFAVGEHVPHQTLRIPFVLGKGRMAVGLGPAVPRKMLAAGGHAAPAKPANERGGMRRHELGRRAKAEPITADRP